jgi:hypothetical protein
MPWACPTVARCSAKPSRWAIRSRSCSSVVSTDDVISTRVRLLGQRNATIHDARGSWRLGPCVLGRGGIAPAGTAWDGVVAMANSSSSSETFGRAGHGAGSRRQPRNDSALCVTIPLPTRLACRSACHGIRGHMRLAHDIADPRRSTALGAWPARYPAC